MHLVIHDASLRKVAFVDNTKQNTLKYIKYEWYRSLETAGSTFNVTIQKKAIQSDNRYEVAYNHLNERSFITFKAKNKTHLFSVMVVTENEETITCECESANLELINEYANPYKATNAMSFVEYCNAMGLLSFTYLTIGLNEVSDKSLTLEWEGQDTKLARLLSLANKFDAEIEFDTRLNADSSIKQFILNVYHKNDDTHQGVGRIREDVQLVYGKNIKSVTRTIDKTNVVNAIRPTGTKDGNTVVISGLSAWEEKNKDGIVEFYQKGEMLYAPISMQLYPSTFTHSTIDDQWTRKDITVDSDNPTVIRAEGIKDLKRLAYPSITYEVDGFFDGEIGDTVKVIDNGFVPKLILKARVIEQYIYDDETKNKTVLGNFTALENRLSDDIQTRLNELVEKAKPYTIKLSTDNGVVFKNQEGDTVVTPRLYKGGQPFVGSVVWSWALDGVTTTGLSFRINGYDVKETSNLVVSAYVDNVLVASTEVTLTNLAEPILMIIKTNNGTVFKNGAGNSQITPTLKRGSETISGASFVWTINEASTTASTYTVTAAAVTGTSVVKVEAILSGKVVASTEITFTNVSDGANAYFFVAYADSPDGSTGFNLTDASKRYMGHYSSSNPTQSQSYASYKWVDRANVTATFVQSSAPANPPTGSRWKYTGTTVITANSSTISPGEQYLFIGARWVKDVITSDNLQIKDQFINGPMIKNGAVTVDKLNVGNISAITADLGNVTAGDILLQRNFGAGTSVAPAFNYPAHKTGLFVDNYGLIVNGSPVQKFATEDTASDMPVVAVTSGEIRFLRANVTDNIKEVLHTGLADPDFGYIRFGRDIDGKNALVIEANGQVYLKGENYTDWEKSTVNPNVRWKVQSNLVIVDYDVTFSTGGTRHIITVPTKYVPKALMLTAKAWRTSLDRDKNAQLNADGGLHILAADANQRYCGQFLWSY